MTVKIDFTLGTPSGCWHYAGTLEAMSRPEIDALRELIAVTTTELARAIAIEEHAAVVDDRGAWLRPRPDAA